MLAFQLMQSICGFAFLGLIILFVLWVIALNLDEFFFEGRFLVRDKIDKEELRNKLEQVLRYKESTIDELPSDIEYWFFDYFYNVALYNKDLDALRKPIIDSIKNDSNPRSFSPETIIEIEKALQKLKM